MVRGHSRSLAIAMLLFDKAYATNDLPLIETTLLPCTVFEILRVKSRPPALG